MHFGVWENGIDCLTDALEHSNEVLIRDISITKQTRILDVGCGIGSFAVWCARAFGCRVVGISNCASHIAIARELANEHGVAELCEFVVMDMSSLDLPSAGFEIVINQESYCYAPDKCIYLQEVYRLLAPGGIWSAMAFSLRDGPLGLDELRERDAVLDGFHIPKLLPGSTVSRLLSEVGFVDCEYEDLTSRVQRTASHILRHCYIPVALTRLRLDWMFFRGGSSSRLNHQGHFRAGMAYSQGLLRGWGRHNRYRAHKPDGLHHP
jgi:ubiquinone/menaquinone biosynthesis C-methylase UbiE